MNLPPASRYGGVPMQVQPIEVGRPEGQAKGVTEKWHNRYLCTTILLLLTTCLFAGLFGGFYSAWSHRPPCEIPDDEIMQWSFGTGPEFDDACHVLHDDALHALEGVSCPTDCEAWWHERHPVYSPSEGRRLVGTRFKDRNYGSNVLAALRNCQKTTQKGPSRRACKKPITQE